jgi:hypothetical protein
VATRYGDEAKAIEVWNEPNDPDYWGGCHPSSTSNPGFEKYLQILNFAGRGVVDSQRNVPLVTAGLTPADSPDVGQVQWDAYLRDVLDNRNQLDPATQAALDYVGLHPYRTKDERDASFQAYDESALKQLNLAEAIVANRDLNMPVWVTEAGTTNAPNFEPPHVQPPTYVAGGPSSQGFWDFAIYDLLRNRGAPVTLIHRFADRPLGDAGHGPYWSEYGYGIVDDYADGSHDPKYGYCLLAQERTQEYPDPQPPGC